MSAVGRELIERYGLEIRIPGEDDLDPSAPPESARGAGECREPHRDRGSVPDNPSSDTASSAGLPKKM
jgi:hypothetical protein